MTKLDITMTPFERTRAAIESERAAAKPAITRPWCRRPDCRDIEFGTTTHRAGDCKR